MPVVRRFLFIIPALVATFMAGASASTGAAGALAPRLDRVASTVTISVRFEFLDYDCGTPYCYETIFRGRIHSDEQACRNGRRVALNLEGFEPSGFGPLVSSHSGPRGRWRARLAGGSGKPPRKLRERFYARIKPKRVTRHGRTILCSGDRSEAAPRPASQ